MDIGQQKPYLTELSFAQTIVEILRFYLPMIVLIAIFKFFLDYEKMLRQSLSLPVLIFIRIFFIIAFFGYPIIERRRVRKNYNDTVLRSLESKMTLFGVFIVAILIASTFIWFKVWGGR